VFWVEAFNEGAQKWIPVDPLVTKSLAKSHNLEPPATDQFNAMSYVVAFDEDTTARDVTRRYTRAFNAKTRKLRVESTKGGDIWWENTMRAYEKPYMTDRDAMEITDLTSRAAGEPMPRNVQDFKDHPFYALERHIRRNEVIFPKRVIGHVAVGKPGSQNEGQETVYRRSDVHVVRSADKWYRLGRDIKMGEQPLKRVPAQRSKNASANMDEEDDWYAAETPLYAEYQTELYKAPPVVRGRVPRNGFGNLDIYAPNMVPPGGVHVKRPDAAHAAKILAIDYVPAVTGFDFKGRHGTAVFHGIVIASENHAAVELVTGGLEDERRLAELAEKSSQAIRLWKHFLLRLRIIERVKGYAVEGDVEPSADTSDQNYEDLEDTAGGFLPEPDNERRDPSLGIERRPGDHDHLQTVESGNDYSYTSTAQDESLGGGFIPEGSPVGAEQVEPMQVDDGFTTEARAQQPDHGSQYTLVVVPSDAVHKDESNAPRDLHQREAKPSASAYREKEAVHPEEDAPKALESPSETAGTKESTAGDMRPPSSQGPSHTAPQTGPQENTQEPTDKGSDSEYQGSMLSEDPEDIDSFPEWLL
jgi:xeroderma pigmentosum group C-complementing protein